MSSLFLILFLLSLVLLPVSLIKPSLILRFSKPTRKKALLIFGSLLVVSFILFGVTAEKKPVNEPQKVASEVQTQQEQSQVTATPKPTETPKPKEAPKQEEVQKLGYEESKTVENFFYLFLGNEKSKENLERIAKDIKTKECKKPCNISLFDDKRAYELDRERSNLTTKEAIDAWNNKDYIYVAEHLLGQLTFDTDTFLYYPLKDWFYEELKSKR